MDADDYLKTFLIDKYGEELGPTVFVNLTEAAEPFKLDGDIILGSHTLEIDVNSDTGRVLITKVLADQEAT